MKGVLVLDDACRFVRFSHEPDWGSKKVSNRLCDANRNILAEWFMALEDEKKVLSAKKALRDWILPQFA